MLSFKPDCVNLLILFCVKGSLAKIFNVNVLQYNSEKDHSLIVWNFDILAFWYAYFVR